MSQTKRPVCARKVSYRSEDQAKHAMSRIHQAGGPKMRPYRCPFCGRFHLTSQPKG